MVMQAGLVPIRLRRRGEAELRSITPSWTSPAAEWSRAHTKTWGPTLSAIFQVPACLRKPDEAVLISENTVQKCTIGVPPGTVVRRRHHQSSPFQFAE